MHMENSRYITKVKELLKGVAGKELSADERQEKAVEIAKLLLNESRRVQTSSEYAQQRQLAAMMKDFKGKVFTIEMTDQCFRSHRKTRIADQILYLIKKTGIPRYISWSKKMKLLGFKHLGKNLSSVLVPMAQQGIRKEMSNVILPGERGRLYRLLNRRRKEGVRINLNHLGEAILGEKEADKRLQIYLDDLSSPEVEYISVKVSSIYSQINLLAWEDTIDVLASRLRLLFRAARDREFVNAKGEKVQKFVNLDMEEYRDLHLTVAAFRKVLEEPEFFHHSAGIVLQAYLPDSYLIQQELTVWAMQRVASGGAPIKMRIVKGANLMMEQFDAALNNWPQAPYSQKADVDANFKRMVDYACQPDHAQAVFIGVASHNLFDISYALTKRAEKEVEEWVNFEMLEGMAPHMARVIHNLTGDMLLYCPATTHQEFHTAVAYLMRRLDENTAPENYLRAAFDLIPNTKDWNHQASQFSNSCYAAKSVSFKLRRTQNRLLEPERPDFQSPFDNEPDTDWSLSHNRKWADEIVKKWKDKESDTIPLVIDGKEVFTEELEEREDPSRPGTTLFHYSIANSEHIETALEASQKANSSWSSLSVAERSKILADIAHGLRQKRGDLIGAMMADAGKTMTEADPEVSEAIDFAEYYRRSLEELHSLEDIAWSPLGTVLVAPPWNFPCAIPTGGVLAALAAGNTVILKPSRKAVSVAWEIANICWNAGVGKDVLQFVVCPPEPQGTQLVIDERVQGVILTGGTETAKQMLELRPGINLMAETGGKNAMIVTGMADRDLAIKDIIKSAFGHSGQKCSACSLLILEAEVYDDKRFLEQLKDAAASLKVGPSWDMATKVNPLIGKPGKKLMQGLTQLEKGERWLLKPNVDRNNPNLWSPGIKLGVKKGGKSHQTEFFGPVLSVMRADNLEDAIRLANATPYGLTGGLHSLDEREHQTWLEKIRIGNGYINRGITGAIVQRQPFGGCKESSFGKGIKAGGPNYLTQLMHAHQSLLPEKHEKPSSDVQKMAQYLQNYLSTEEMEIWNRSIGSYAHAMKHYFSKDHDPTLLQGQDNLLRYLPRQRLTLRVQKNDRLIDTACVIAASLTCKTPIEVSSEEGHPIYKEWDIPHVTTLVETDEELHERVKTHKIRRIRFTSSPKEKVAKYLATQHCNCHCQPVLANGRLELLNYLREFSISYDYHRYGNLGARENEKRKPLRKP